MGRGTETPFEEFGAPWIDGVDVAAQFNALHLPGFCWFPGPAAASLFRGSMQASVVEV